MVVPLLLMAVIAAPAAVAAADEAPAPAVADSARIEHEKGPYLIGPLSREAWSAFAPELAPEAASYEPSPDVVAALSALDRDLRVVCVLGTWCSDSRREVPRFWKVMEACGLAAESLEMLAVGRADDPAALAWEESRGVAPGYRARYGVELVPTFIVYEGGLELGRIVETPAVSLEADLAAILGVRATPAWH
ncbi:MAG: hypothetical protein C0395_01325 [Gemmatimonas sp.]|nr:hypothetical protein [Gemmatimonas sp.]